MDLLEIDPGNRKIDSEGHLSINGQNVAYLMDLLAKMEEKVDGLYEVSKHLDKVPEPREAAEDRARGDLRKAEDAKRFQDSLKGLMEKSRH